MKSTQVVVIGGGVTGTGILWDLALRGIPAVLLEQADLAHGTSSRYHGILHSGGRYVVRDPAAAKECIEENAILKRIAASCIEDTGSLFVHVEGDDPDYIPKFVAGCQKVGILAEEISRQQALELEPNLSPHITVAYKLPSAHIDAFLLTLALSQAAIKRGAQVKTYTQVTGLAKKDKVVKGVYFKNRLTGEEDFLACDLVINAAGPWAGHIASMAGIKLELLYDRGAMIIYNHRLINRVIDRLRMPGDGDAICPAGLVTILGTTSAPVSGPEDLQINPGEIDYLKGLGAQLIPALANARILRTFAGIRPLYNPDGDSGAKGRSVSRNFVLLDHEELDGLAGFISIAGGKLSTYRLMAQVTTDLACRKLSVDRSCTTDTEPVQPPATDDVLLEARKIITPPLAEKVYQRLGPDTARVVDRIKADPAQAEIVCECELITRAELELVMDESYEVPARKMSDLSRRTRLGMGPCQGTFCGYRAMLIGYEKGHWTALKAREELTGFMERRWKGQSLISTGKQTEQLNISHKLYNKTFNMSGSGDKLE